MEPWIIDLLKILGPVILGGSAWIGVGQYKKSKAEAHKTRVEADKLQTSIGPESEAITAQSMREAITTMRDIAADANASRERAEAAERIMREELTHERKNNEALWTRVRDLEDAARTNERERIENRRRMAKLENNLSAAKLVVQELIDYIRRHHDPSTGDIPRIDFSIFDV